VNHKIAYLVQYTALCSTLDLLASLNITATYGQVARAIGLQARSQTFFEMLGETMDEDMALGNAPRCALVVTSKTGRPGPAFYERAVMMHGVTIAAGAEEAFHDLMKQQVFAAANK